MVSFILVVVKTFSSRTRHMSWYTANWMCCMSFFMSLYNVWGIICLLMVQPETTSCYKPVLTHGGEARSKLHSLYMEPRCELVLSAACHQFWCPPCPRAADHKMMPCPGPLSVSYPIVKYLCPSTRTEIGKPITRVYLGL